MLTKQQRAMIAKKGQSCGMNFRDRLVHLYGMPEPTATILAKPYKERSTAIVERGKEKGGAS